MTALPRRRAGGPRLAFAAVAATVLVFTALIALAVLGCGGGGGGGTPTAPPPAPPPPPPPPADGVFFVSDGTPSAATIYVFAEEVTPLAGPLFLEIDVEEIEDLYGASFDLRFPSDLIRFESGGTVEGDFLSESGAVATSLLVDRVGSGRLVVGISRLGDVGGASGSGNLMTLEFSVRGGVDGRGRFRFRMEEAFNSDGSTKTEAAWLEGGIEIIR